jgi:hypothetical protein
VCSSITGRVTSVPLKKPLNEMKNAKIIPSPPRYLGGGFVKFPMWWHLVVSQVPPSIRKQETLEV